MADSYTVYCLTNTINGKRYIGQTKSRLSQRLALHVSRSRHGARYAISHAIAKYGIGAFVHEVLEEGIPEDIVDERERYFIALFRTMDRLFGYNLTSGGSQYKRLSEATREKLRNAQRSKWKDSKYRESQQAAMRLKVLTAEHRKKIGIAGRGRKHSAESIEKVRQAHIGSKRNPETCRRIGAAKRGVIHSPETKAKISTGNLLAWARRKAQRWQKRQF